MRETLQNSIPRKQILLKFEAYMASFKHFRYLYPRPQHSYLILWGPFSSEYVTVNPDLPGK